MPHATVLLVTSEKAIADSVRGLVETAKDCDLKTVADFAKASFLVHDSRIGLLLVHVPGVDEVQQVISLLQETADSAALLPVVALTRQNNAELRLQLLRSGALDCLALPGDMRRLAFLVDILTLRARCGVLSATERRKMVADESASRVDGFLFDSHAARKLLKQLRAAAPLDATILLTGETGVGKTHLARVIHALSPRRDKPFSVVHCGALPPALLESELFGHVRGAFTHAERDRLGKLAEVQDGTLLLDEVDSVPCEAQVKLLRAVEERVFEPVGSNKSHRLRARLVAAANRPLEQEVAAGRFRADLYYRLNVISFCLPPLRQERELIQPLAEKFLAEACARDHRDVRGFSAEALDTLRAYHWPGNARELRNVVDRAVALSNDPIIALDDLPPAIGQAVQPHKIIREGPPPRGGNHLARARMSAESEKLIEALRRHDNNRTSAAAALGISRMTLYKKLRRHGLS